MSYELIIFVHPDFVTGVLTTDNGKSYQSHPATHSTGRLGIGFTIEDATPQINGCRLNLTGNGQVPIIQRSRLVVRNGDGISNSFPWDSVAQSAALLTDDFELVQEKVCPEIPIPPVPTTNPQAIIDKVYVDGHFDLKTKQGCGEFTEAACQALHEQHSLGWGHLEKFPPQNHWPEVPYVPNGKVHAVDAIQLMQTAFDGYAAGVYDIIFSTESPEAKPLMQFKGHTEPTLFYYPAK